MAGCFSVIGPAFEDSPRSFGKLVLLTVSAASRTTAPLNSTPDHPEAKRVKGLGFRVKGLRFRVKGLGFRV